MKEEEGKNGRWAAGRLLIAVLAVGLGTGAGPEPDDTLVAPDGVPYDNEESQRVMEMDALTENLLANGGFEAGRWWPAGWQATDGLTTFWEEGGTEGKRCLRVHTNVLDAQWKARDLEVRAAVERAAREAGGNPQALQENPVPAPPEPLPTRPPYYDTVAGLHGVHYRSDYVPVKPRAVYRFSIDARAEAVGTPDEPRVFIKGFFDQKMETRDGVRTIRRNAYRAPMILDPCDSTWHRYARTFHPWESESTLGDRPLKPQYLQVQIYAYWKPGDYWFDNVRLDIVGHDEPEPEAEEAEQDRPAPDKPLEVDESGFPVLDP